MKKIGLLLLVFGVGSFALHEMGLEFKLLSLVDELAGYENAVYVRAGLAALGLLLIIAGFATDKRSEPQS